MTVIEALCFAGDLISHGTAQAAAHQHDLTHGFSSRASTHPGYSTIVDEIAFKMCSRPGVLPVNMDSERQVATPLRTSRSLPSGHFRAQEADAVEVRPDQLTADSVP